jgi:hypothetical protein
MKAGTLVLLVASAGASCSPGVLDPREGAWWEDGGGDEEPGDGGAPAAGLSDSTKLEGCAKLPTVGAFERDMLVARCGTAGCHQANGRPFAPDLATRPIYPRLLDQLVTSSATTCDKEKDRYIDSAADPARSYLVAKVRDAKPLCPSGSAGGVRMPFLKPALTDDEVACFLAYVEAVRRSP